MYTFAVALILPSNHQLHRDTAPCHLVILSFSELVSGSIKCCAYNPRTSTTLTGGGNGLQITRKEGISLWMAGCFQDHVHTQFDGIWDL